MTKNGAKSYRELEQELAAVLSRIEQAEYDELEDLLRDYDLGKQLIDTLQKKLQLAKNSIKKEVKA